MPTDHPEFVHASAPREADRLVAETVAAIRAADGIVVGPWLGEVGFEVLYWIPFLHWLFEEHGIATTNVTVVSRGGVAPWYDGICDRYVEIFDSITPDEFRAATLELWTATGGLQKQVAVRPWDEHVLDATVGDGWRGQALLHPQLLYRLFRNVWQGALPLRSFLDRAVHRPWRRPDGDGVVEALPEDFAAVRFYFRESFPDTAENRRLVSDVIERLVARRPVVLLDTGVVVDEHVDVEASDDPRLHRPLAGVAAGENLLAQSAVLSRAAVFAGTYGGIAHLAPFYGVPTIGFTCNPAENNPVHIAVARRTAAVYESPLAIVDGPAFELLDALASRALPVR